MLYFNTLIVCTRELVRSSLLLWEAVGILYGFDGTELDGYEADWASSIKLRQKLCWPITASRYVERPAQPRKKRVGWWDRLKEQANEVLDLENRKKKDDDDQQRPVMGRSYSVAPLHQSHPNRAAFQAKARSHHRFSWHYNGADAPDTPIKGGFTSDTGQHGVQTLQAIHEQIENERGAQTGRVTSHRPLFISTGSKTPPPELEMASGMRRVKSTGRLQDQLHYHLPDEHDARLAERARARFMHDQGSSHVDVHGRVEALLADNSPLTADNTPGRPPPNPSPEQSRHGVSSHHSLLSAQPQPQPQPGVVINVASLVTGSSANASAPADLSNVDASRAAGASTRSLQETSLGRRTSAGQLSSVENMYTSLDNLSKRS